MSRSLLALFVALALVQVGVAADAPRKPNVLIILSDDMGFSDIGCYGGEIATPNLDALAAKGLRFTQFYNTARCCPTRASLLTGLYSHQAGVGHMTEDKGKPGYRGELNDRCRTIAQVLHPAGYRTYAVGKWHVCRDLKPAGPNYNWPLQRGFDRFYGMLSGGGSFYDPNTLCQDNTQISPYTDPDYRPKTYYFTDAITDHAVRFLGDHAKDHADEPFFMYVAYTAAHWPMHALPEDIAKYHGKYDGGYEPIRKARLEKAAKLGLVEPDQGLSPQAREWDAVKNKAREIACMEVYAAMVDRMDQGVGRIVAELRRTGRLDDTLILYLQDNGGSAETMGRDLVKGRESGPRKEKPSLPPIPSVALPNGLVPPQTRDGYPVRQGPDVIPGAADTFVAYGQGWANVSNTPFREYKHWVHEGGISTPLIAHWPSGISAHGELRRQPGHLIDLAATIYDVAGATYPKAATPLEGKSLLSAFANKPLERDTIFWEHEGNRAVRVGNWKLVAKDKSTWQLHDLTKDRVEAVDLAAKHPEIVKDLAARYEAWTKRAYVEPWPVKTTPTKKP
jgi:arylsulfatase A-like enzyme